MRPTHLSILTLCAAVLCLACEAAGAETSSDPGVFRRYGTPDALVQGTLLLEGPHHGQRLSGVIQLTDGTCLAEEATLDEAGRLATADVWLSGPAVEEPTHVFLNPTRGVVELSAASRQIAWSVPSDLPWIWQPILSTGASLATPLSAVIALRAAADGRSVRSLELDTFHSHSVTADQVLVADEEAATVVLGDDAADMADGLPTRIHFASLDRDLQVFEPGQSPALAALSCSDAAAPQAL